MENSKTLELNLSLIREESRICMLYINGLEDLQLYLLENCQLSPDRYFLKKNGRAIYNYENLDGIVHVVPRLCGGKGGFGSMLRAIGAQIEKTTNREACRDLSGRRLRDINEEQRLKKWISQQAEREKETEERKKKKLQKLSAEPKFEFSDKTYDNERADLVEKLSDSVEQGFKAATSKKRPIEVDQGPVKNRKTILDFDDDLSSSDSDMSSRDINEEQLLDKSISQEAEKEEEAEECKEKKLQQLSDEPKFIFSDKTHDNKRADLGENLSDSVEQGLKVETSIKRPIEVDQKTVKKRKTTVDINEDLSSSNGECSSPNESSEEKGDKNCEVVVKIS